MSADNNPDRAKFYPPNDLAAGMYRDRVAKVLSTWTKEDITEINEAIEIYQCQKTIMQYPELFDSMMLDRLNSSVDDLIPAAVSTASILVSTQSLGAVCEKVELQYVDQFWEFIAKFKLWRQVPDTDLYALIRQHPEQIVNVLSNPVLIRGFDKTITRSMCENHHISAEMIIGSFASENRNLQTLKLPSSLTPAMIDGIMLSYVSESMPNLNHVRVLASWPSSAKIPYSPSPDVLVQAKKKAKELNDNLFPDSTAGVRYGMGVTFSQTQKACKGIELEGNSYTTTYGTEWLSTYTDPGTILNNFIYVFGFADKDGLLGMPAHKHERTALTEALGLHPLGEYPTSIPFNMRNSQALIEVLAYRDLLRRCDCRLETSIEWFYNEYISSEFGVEGFNISLPTEETSYLDKCKSIGPEIERVLKSFKLYVEQGTVDELYFPHIQIKDFDAVPSLIEKKYLVANSEFAKRGHILFSDQSRLAYSKVHPDAGHSFFSMITKERVVRSDFHDIYQPLIDWIANDGLIEIRDDVIEPSIRSLFLRQIWDEGAIPLFHYSDSDRQMGDHFSADEILGYSETLFSPDESDYMNFMFNNAKFSNSMALRNKYDHASSRVDDPNEQPIQEDYCRLLVLLIGITLKINEELSVHLSKGGVEDFVDWPLLDEESVKKSLEILMNKRRN